MTGTTGSSRVTRAMIVARVATASCSGSLGLSVGIEHPVYGMLILAGLVIAALAVVVLAVCLSDGRSDRLFRWARLILGREEPKSPHGTTATALQADASISQHPCQMGIRQTDQAAVAEPLSHNYVAGAHPWSTRSRRASACLRARPAVRARSR